MSAEPVPGRALLHPVALSCLGLMVLNDQVLKWAFPGVLTGKLSDVAGLVFFPLLLVSMWEWTLSWRGQRPVASRRAVWVALAMTGTVFTAIQLSPAAGAAWSWGLGLLQAPFRGEWQPVRHTMDATDLWALPALGIARWTAVVSERDAPERPQDR